jgi:DNA mismatch repair protein MutS2
MAKGGAGVVPLDVSLGVEDRVMLITGPNAGGKTVVLKTVGLLSLMALSGVPVPARSTSTFPVLGALHVDIGDEQSVEADLSTFSAHVSNISRILAEAGPASLALIDELGTGTDPAEGAAIGSAVLRDLKGRGATVLATTHLVDIVAFVHREAGMANASMAFDQATHAPLYRLRRGEPGRSHALDIARRYGLPETTLEYARSLLGTSGALLEELFSELREKRAGHERARALLEAEREKVLALDAKLNERLAGLKAEREAALEAAEREALAIIADARRKAYDALEDAKKSRRAAVKELEEAAREAEAKLRKEPALPIGDIKPGDVVFVGTIGSDAEVASVDVKAGRVRVRAGDKELEVDASAISKGKGKPPSARKKRAPEREEAAAPASLNLVGKRVEAALDELEPFLNHASMSGARDVVVIHGIGTGALMRAVREHLTGHPLVESFRPGGRGEGGEGVTVARLR